VESAEAWSGLLYHRINMTLPELKDEVLDFIDLNKINVDSDLLYHFVLEHRLRAVQEYQAPKSLTTTCMSRAKLETPNGMHYGCCYAKEILWALTWFRIELYHDAEGILRAASYVRRGAYWKPFSNDICAMYKRLMLAEAIAPQEAACK
jgi:hypothetical protein